MTIGQFIKEARLKKGMTQEELAAKTDISVRTIQRIENGDVDPRSYTLQTITSVLGIDYEELMNSAKNEYETGSSQNDHLWLAFLHLSGLFILLIPPIIIWIIKKDEIQNIRENAIAVINFQLSMLIYLIPSGLLVMLIIGLPLVIFFGIYSTIVIIINTIRVLINLPYRYPLTIKILKP